MSKPTTLSQGGFTIIELMVATLVFSVILVTITVGVLSFTNAYYKGINGSTTQDVARSAMDTISQSIQFSGTTVTPTSAPTNFFCAGGQVFIYSKGIQYNGGTATSANAGLYMVPANGGCKLPAGATYSGGKQLLTARMRVADISVVPGASGNLYTVSIRLAYGDDDLLTATSGPSVQCKSQDGSQFCAVSALSSTVQRRVVN